ncbi:YqhR family membrane protein [Brevibacillus ruminantium]|uniref:YqhR family membrane protein n=1 Tax=Brevibacillus ruminantium TaxID=2950604 RepID=A0ABY4WCM0_9BACL|nr:YqhR family membrane protein [Brevibacillus ruminantium]USG63662.1 YqhR family membrane protein [Brevibacillus ruminantium]
MSMTKTRGYRDRNETEEREQVGVDSAGKAKAFPFVKMVEVAFWGTVFWGVIARSLAHLLNFTPYGLGAYARPMLGAVHEDSWPAIWLGALMLFFESLLAVFLYSVLFKRSRIWWSGLLYGLMLLVVAGFFFRMGNWDQSTLSTEIGWYLSYGLFVGMTVTLEQHDQA